jgi:hypothetical protein
MTLIGRCGAVLVLGGLSGCVVAPLPQAPLPLVAVPGPAKSAAEFQQDDVACRTAAASSHPPAAPAAAPAQPGQPAPQGQAQADQSQTDAASAVGIYLHCMESHNNVVQPLVPIPPLIYAGYAGYGYAPFYGPYDGYGPYPWLYDGYPGFYGAYFGVGYGWRGGYGYGGGYRGGEYGGGFHGGGGARR